MLTKSDAPEFEAILNGLLVEVYARAPLSRDGLRLWWAAMSRYSMAEIRAALSAHTMDADVGQFPPKPADIVKRLEGTGEGRAFGAWNKALAAVQRVGTYADVVFDDPIIHAVIADMGGWVKLGQTPNDEIQFRAAEFVKRYRAYLVVPPTAHLPRLIGIASAENTTRGYASPPPVMIGDPAACALVYQSGNFNPLQITAPRSAEQVLKALELKKEN